MRCIVTSVQRIFCVFSSLREKLSNAFSFFTITYSSEMLCIAWCRAFLRCVAAFSLRVCDMRRRFSLHIYARGGVFVNIYKYEAFFEKYFSEIAQNAWLFGLCMLCWHCKSKAAVPSQIKHLKSNRNAEKTIYYETYYNIFSFTCIAVFAVFMQCRKVILRQGAWAAHECERRFIYRN